MNHQQEIPAVGQIVKRLDMWLETMRNADGYAGPVAHWWQNCLQYTGVGLDWRYEGIIHGYLNLYKNTGEWNWLLKAQRAADDLIRGQRETGTYHNSSFEMNPYPGGTPHEAACDIGLLSLAKTLKENNVPVWQTYASTAERNINDYLIKKLWHPEYRFFSDGPTNTLLVLNKAASICEVLFGWFDLTGETELLEKYGLPSLEAIIENQVHASGKLLDGAIDQSIHGKKKTGMFFPFYIARCIPVLTLGYKWRREERFLEAARAALNFILRVQLPDGSFPQVIYDNGHIKRYPQWVAGVGDILRAMDIMFQFGMDVSVTPTYEWLILGMQRSGGCQTAWGFASQGSQRKPSDLPDFLDLLPVCGWLDKCFRYLTSRVSGNLEPDAGEIMPVEVDCLFQGTPARFKEDASVIEVWQNNRVVYRWRKGNSWAETPVWFG